MIVVGQAMRIHEMAVARADLPGLGVHEIGKSVNRASCSLGQGFSSVVARFQQQPVQQILRRDGFAGVESDAAWSRAGGLWTDQQTSVRVEAFQRH